MPKSYFEARGGKAKGGCFTWPADKPAFFQVRRHVYVTSRPNADNSNVTSTPFFAVRCSLSHRQLKELTSHYLSSPKALLSPSFFVAATSASPSTLLPHAVLYVINTIPTDMTPAIERHLCEKTDYINRLLVYVKTGKADGPFIVPKSYDWSDVVEWRLNDVYNSHEPTSSPLAVNFPAKWAADRAILLLAITYSIKASSDGRGAAAAIIGPCAVAELGACAETGNYAAAVVIMEAVEKVAGMSGESDVNDMFDLLDELAASSAGDEGEDGGSEMGRMTREWVRELEKRVFAEEITAAGGGGKDDDKAKGKDGEVNEIRFTPGVMTRRR